MQIRLSAGADSLICCASAGSTSIPHITVAQALPSEAEFAARIAESSRDDPCLAREENGQVFVYSMHIAPYVEGNRFNHLPLRTRRLLLHKKEILKIAQKVKERGIALVPLKLYLKNGRVKMELGLAKGKTFGDKRETLRKKQDELDVRRSAARYS